VGYDVALGQLTITKKKIGPDIDRQSVVSLDAALRKRRPFLLGSPSLASESRSEH